MPDKQKPQLGTVAKTSIIETAIMKAKIAFVKNIQRLVGAYDALESSETGIPRMGLVYGVPGSGKSVATAWLMNRTNAILVRAAPTWTLNSMLSSIMTELGMLPLRNADSMKTAIVEKMGEDNRPLFVDEIDMFTNPNVKPQRAGAIIETLRTFHDMSGMPVVLIGMNGVERHLNAYKQVTSRIAQWVNFQPATFEDAKVLAADICEIDISDDLLTVLHSKSKGNMRLMTVGLSRIERAAKGAGLKAMDLNKWGDRPFSLNGILNGAHYED
jgi:DNA transposition AAA+ family ATPase